MNCDRIYPIQQKKVQSLTEHISQNDNVEQIVVFGSSVTSRCHIDSDVDLYVKTKKEEKLITKAFYFVYDL